jgi:hypothetical protein
LVCELGPAAHPALTRLLGSGPGGRLLGWIVRAQWDQVVSHLPELRRRLSLQALKRDYLNALRYWLAEARRFWDRWRFPTGVSVAVLSPAGECTDTLVRDLQEMFTKVFRQSAVFKLPSSLYLREGSYSSGNNSHSHLSYRSWRSGFAFFRHRMNYVLHYVWRVRPLLVQSTLVFLEGHCDERMGRHLRHLLPGPSLVPRTDLLLILGSPESNSLTSELVASGGEFRHEWSPCMCLPVRWPKAVLLDARLSTKGISKRACQALSAFLTERYDKRRPVWFTTSGAA